MVFLFKNSKRFVEIRIWQKLLKIVNEQAKTIILTTHYIEEAHQAQTVRKNIKNIII